MGRLAAPRWGPRAVAAVALAIAGVLVLSSLALPSSGAQAVDGPEARSVQILTPSDGAWLAPNETVPVAWSSKLPARDPSTEPRPAFEVGLEALGSPNTVYETSEYTCQAGVMPTKTLAPAVCRSEVQTGPAGGLYELVVRALPTGTDDLQCLGIVKAQPEFRCDRVRVRVDASPPTSTLTLDPSQPEGEDGVYREHPVVFLLSCRDGESGCERVMYRVGDEPAHRYEGPFRLSNGTHEIEYWAVDEVGNEQTPHGELLVEVEAEGDGSADRHLTTAVHGYQACTGTGDGDARACSTVQGAQARIERPPGQDVVIRGDVRGTVEEDQAPLAGAPVEGNASFTGRLDCPDGRICSHGFPRTINHTFATQTLGDGGYQAWVGNVTTQAPDPGECHTVDVDVTTLSENARAGADGNLTVCGKG